MYALPVVKGRPYMPVHVVEEALTDSARASYFQSSPEQAAAWHSVGSTEKPRSPPATETKAEQHDPVVAGGRPLLPADLEQPDLGAPSEGPSRDKEEGPVKAPKRPRLGAELPADS
eukprot:448651-Pyramimonas_sp.AAC.1